MIVILNGCVFALSGRGKLGTDEMFAVSLGLSCSGQDARRQLDMSTMYGEEEGEGEEAGEGGKRSREIDGMVGIDASIRPSHYSKSHPRPNT